jgi:glutathione S-transferase
VTTPTPAPQPSVTLFGHWSCPYSTRVSFALAHRGVAHDLIEVPPTKMRPDGFVPPVEFTENSPLGEIPLVEVDGTYRADSLPIIEWLDHCLGGDPLIPSDPRARAQAFERARFVDEVVFSAMIGVYYGTSEERIASSSRALAHATEQLGSWLGESPWLAGSSVTIADAALVPLWVRLELLWEVGLSDRLDPLALEASIEWTDAERRELLDRILIARARS